MHCYKPIAVILLLFLYVSYRLFFIVSDGKKEVLFLSPYSEEFSYDVIKGFKNGMSEMGFFDGDNFSLTFLSYPPLLNDQFDLFLKNIKKPDLVVALSSFAAEVLSRKYNDVPLLFCNLKSNKALGLFREDIFDFCGVLDPCSFLFSLDFMQKVFPRVKNIGFIIRPSDLDSVICLDFLKESANIKGIELVCIISEDTESLVSKLKYFKDKIDVLFAVPSVSLCFCMDVISDFCIKNFIPLVTDHKSYVESKKCVASIHLSDYKKGYILSIMASEVFKGSRASDLPMHLLSENDASGYLSLHRLKGCHLSLPSYLRNVVVLS